MTGDLNQIPAFWASRLLVSAVVLSLHGTAAISNGLGPEEGGHLPDVKIQYPD
jgi:hypothetical protein